MHVAPTDRPALAQTNVEDEVLPEAARGVPPRAVRVVQGKVLAGTRYKIIRWLGEGSTGVVYEAENIEIGRRVAIKILRSELRLRHGLVEMFRAEARTLGRLDCPYVVQALDLVTLPDGRVALPMQLVDGRNLEEIVADGALSPDRVLVILRQLCKGLSAAHAEGIVHGDVKPSNTVVVTAGGREDGVRILDFGLSAAMARAETSEAPRGSPYYMAPEQANRKPTDARTDVYGLGCTGYQLLSGRPPFLGETVDEVLELHRHGVPDALPASVPRALRAVIGRCLHKEPSDRYASMADVEAALCEAQIDARITTPWDDLPLPEIGEERRAALAARMPTTGERARWGWRRISILATAAAVALGLAAAWVWRGPTDADLEHVAALAVDVRGAADDALYVYPAAHAPQAPTAYTKVRDLERLDNSASSIAQSRAQELRAELAHELVALGDEYWERAEGRPVATGYYVQALVFEPTEPRAQARAAVTVGQLAQLQGRAESQDFSPVELDAAAPLLALAAPPAEREAKVRALAKRPPQLGAVAGADLRTLAGGADAPSPAVSTPSASPQEPAIAAAPPVPAPPDDPSDALPSPTGAVDPPAEQPRRDPAKARALAREGSAALARSDVAVARNRFERALALDEKLLTALAGLSDLHFDAGRFSEAARYARGAVAAAPRSGAQRIRLGDAYYQLVRYADAKEAYARAAKLGDPRAEKRLEKLAGKLGE